MRDLREIKRNIPEAPGVYLMKGERGRILYIGKAGNLRRRVKSYFTRANEARIETLLKKIKKIDLKKTDSALDALILEAQLIKKHEPPFNIREKDDKSFLWIEITKEDFPRVVLVREKNKDARSKNNYFGPFIYGSEAREALRILRRIFPFSVHPPEKAGKFKRLCFDAEIGLCPGVCVGAVSRKRYLENIRGLKQVLKGKKNELIKNMEREMKIAAERTEFERAGRLKKRIFALRHLQDATLIGIYQIGVERSADRISEEKQIEGYDISNISGSLAVGSMVVFQGGAPKKDGYRKFRIQTVSGPNDTAMIKEVLERRFKRDWPHPDLILIDGGKGQVSAAEEILSGAGFVIPVLGIAKGKKRKRNDIIGKMPEWIDKETLVRVRDEAHRFAITYHRRLGRLGK